jgi:hypothetical protein
MKGSVFLLLFSFLQASVSYGQEKKFNELDPDIEWGDGSILLNSGKELKGLVRFNDREGLLSYESGSQSATYTSRSVTAFEFYDERIQKQRIFYSLEYEDSKTNVKRPLFFELLRDLGNFAILSKMDPVDIKEQSSGSGMVQVPGFFVITPATSNVKIIQIETVYFLDQDGKIEPYVKVVRKETDGLLIDTSKMKNKSIDKTLPKKYFGEDDYKKILEYAEELDLKINKKEDFLKILDYYESIRVKN